MSERDPNGPSFENLLKLRDALPSLAKGLREKKIGNRGRPVLQPRPRKTCPICCCVFDYVSTSDDIELVAQNCEKCQSMLNEGYIAFTGGDKYCFAKSERLKDMAGTVVQLPPHVMERLAETYGLEWKVQEKNNGEGTTQDT